MCREIGRHALAISRLSSGREILQCVNCDYWRYVTAKEIEQMAEADRVMIAQGLKNVFAKIRTRKVEKVSVS